MKWLLKIPSSPQMRRSLPCKILSVHKSPSFIQSFLALVSECLTRSVTVVFSHYKCHAVYFLTTVVSVIAYGRVHSPWILTFKISGPGKSRKTAFAPENPGKGPGKWDVLVLEFYHERCTFEAWNKSIFLCHEPIICSVDVYSVLVYLLLLTW